MWTGKFWNMQEASSAGWGAVLCMDDKDEYFDRVWLWGPRGVEEALRFAGPISVTELTTAQAVADALIRQFLRERLQELTQEVEWVNSVLA